MCVCVCVCVCVCACVRACVCVCVCCNEIAQVLSRMREYDASLQCIVDHPGFRYKCLDVWVRYCTANSVLSVSPRTWNEIATAICT